MRQLILICFILVSLTSQSQDRIGNKKIQILYENGKPVKAYAEVEDCITFMFSNTQYTSQDVTYYYNYGEDCDVYQPTLQESLQNSAMPTPVSDKYLKSLPIYVLMQSHFKLAQSAYNVKAECVKKAENHDVDYFEVPLMYRTRESYDELKRIRKRQQGL